MPIAVHAAACWRSYGLRAISTQRSVFNALHRHHDLPKIVAVDLQPMAPIEGVIQLQVESAVYAMPAKE